MAESEHDGRLATSRFWIELARKFREIDPYELLSMDWQLASFQDRNPGLLAWGFSGAPESIIAKFMALATIGGKRLRPTDDDPSVVWFTLLKNSYRQVPPYRVDTMGQAWFLRRACDVSARLCALQDPGSEERQQSPTSAPGDSFVLTTAREVRKLERTMLLKNYRSSFEEKVVVLDICWAARQRYRELTRWLSGELKDGSKPDMAFKAVLRSGKRPEQYRTEPREKGWK